MLSEYGANRGGFHGAACGSIGPAACRSPARSRWPTAGSSASTTTRSRCRRGRSPADAARLRALERRRRDLVGPRRDRRDGDRTPRPAKHLRLPVLHARGHARGVVHAHGRSARHLRVCVRCCHRRRQPRDHRPSCGPLTPPAVAARSVINSCRSRLAPPDVPRWAGPCWWGCKGGRRGFSSGMRAVCQHDSVSPGCRRGLRGGGPRRHLTGHLFWGTMTA